MNDDWDNVWPDNQDFTGAVRPMTKEERERSKEKDKANGKE
jgi:hypothetical protein